MSDNDKKSVSQIRLLDPLSEVTRKERRNLLVAASLGLVMVKVGIIPTKISALGIEFSLSDQRTLLLFVALLIGYFLIAFVLYAISDLIAWRIAFNRAKFDSNIINFNEGVSFEDRDEANKIRKRLRQLSKSSRPISLIRAFLEFVFPFLYSIVTLYILIF